MSLDKLYTLNTEVQNQKPRPYMGLSMIGSSCRRYLQYCHYTAFTTPIPARVQRLFNVGHSAEDIMTADLAKRNIIVTDQQKSIVATSGHWRGHIDGLAIMDGDYHLVEFKTHNDKNFKALVRKGVQKASPGHYAQVTGYMGYLNLSKCLYMALNKNDSEYYFEIIEFDESYFNELVEKEADVLLAQELFPRIGTGMKTWFQCRFCDAKKVCYGEEAPDKNCRTCKHVDVLEDGKWGCYKHQIGLSVKEQMEGCEDYEISELF